MKDKAGCPRGQAHEWDILPLSASYWLESVIWLFLIVKGSWVLRKERKPSLGKIEPFLMWHFVSEFMKILFPFTQDTVEIFTHH